MSESMRKSGRLQAWVDQVSSPVFWIALTLGVIVHLVGFFVFRVFTRSLPVQETRAPFVQYMSADLLSEASALEEQSVLFDSAPLFIPTKWNATREPLRLGRDSSGDGFTDFLPEFDLVGDLRPDGFTSLESYEVSAPVDLLRTRFLDLFAEIGATDPAPEALASSGPGLRILSLREAPVEQFLDLPVEFLAANPALPMRPVKFFVQVSGAGTLLASPTLGESSGQADFDQLATTWLEKSEVVARLPSGFLQIEVYP